MTKFTGFQHTFTALVGALLISTAFVTAAVGPAAAVESSQGVAVQLPASAQA
jgi:hypothetical protein